MGKGKLKKPNVDQGRRIGKPTEASEIPPEQQHPIFSLRYLSGDYCLTKCEKDDKAAFASKLHRLSQLPWSQIKMQGRHKLGFEKIERNSIKASIPTHITPDVKFLAFRFSGMKAMVGYREGYIFHVIWLDRNYTLYDHE